MHKSVHLLHLAIVLFAALPGTFVVEGARPPPIVQVNKCCRIGEYLDRTKNCVVGGTEKWVPFVFMISKKTHFKPVGDAPRFFRIKERTLPNTCSDPELFVGSNNIVIFSNGSLFLYEKSIFVPPGDYCAEQEAALVCFAPVQGMDSLIAPKKLTKVMKCCGPDYIYDEANGTCLPQKEVQGDGFNVRIVNSSNVEVVYGFPECDLRYALVGKFRDEMLNDETGSLILDSGKVMGPSEFCLEHTVGKDHNPAKDSLFVNIFTCSEHFTVAVPSPDQNLQLVLYSGGLLISVIFLSATLAAGFLMPSNHHVLHWRCQTYYVACLLVGDLLLAITQISGNAIPGAGCVIIASLMHLFFLAAFFWLNTMCFNIWWTFRDFRPTSLEKGQEMFRLRIYWVYAWGVPAIIAGVAAILDQIPSQGPNDKFLRPKFGEIRCWFAGDMEILTYFFGPIGILLCINLLLFASTARQLTCGLWKRDDVKSTTERAALGRVCLKLVIVMGVTWVADIISWLVGGPVYVWYLTDLINALQGVFIFIVVGCQPQVWSAVKRIWSSKTGRGVTTTTNGPQHSSSSHGLPSIGETITNNTLTNTTSTKVPMETVC